MPPEKPLLSVLNYGKKSIFPIWFMRQAGRYLPEYQLLRKKEPNFVKFCLNVELTVEAALQPLRRYNLDAAILFSDILMVPFGLGQPLRFEENKGPILSPVSIEHPPFFSAIEIMEERLKPVYESVSLLKKKIPKEVTLIGFAGAPWTVAAYMLEGTLSRDLRYVKSQAYTSPKKFERFLDYIVDATIQHVSRQIEAGAEVIQLFESWAGYIPTRFFEEWLIKPHQKIFSFLNKKFPGIPLISFCKGLGEKSALYVEQVSPAVFSFDETVSLQKAKNLPCVVQGNLDPTLLLKESETLFEETLSLLETFKDKPYIFNLSHGLLPQTDPDLVKKLVNFIRKFSIE